LNRKSELLLDRRVVCQMHNTSPRATFSAAAATAIAWFVNSHLFRCVTRQEMPWPQSGSGIDHFPM